MGRKNRSNSHNDQEDNHEVMDDQSNNDASGDKEQEQVGAKGRMNDLNFAQRRELQRQQAADKRRSKQKCYLCGKAGHVRRQCPGIADDGRGMSRFKGKSDPKTEQQKLQQQHQQQGSRRNHHHHQGRSLSGSSDTSSEQLVTMLVYPEEFSKENVANLVYIDVQCDVLATLEYLRSGRGKVKISQKEAMEEYQTAMNIAAERSNIQAIISKTLITRPDRPWASPITLDLGSIKLFFSLGLDKCWKLDDMEDEDAAILSLVTTIHDNDDVIAVHVALDYTAEAVTKPGMTAVNQKSRFRCCWEAAGQTNVPLQVQILPGAGSLDPEQENVAGTDYALALLTFQSNLSEAIVKYPQLQVHLLGWSGRASHMMALLKAFPNNILAIGLDGAVTFTKATALHECAFEVPLDKLLLTTTNITPSNVANTMGRTAFPQSGWWPFVAESVAHHKKLVTITEIVSKVYETSLKLYPQLAAIDSS